MAQMRAVRANGESVKEHYLARQEQSPVITELKEVVQTELKRLKERKPLGKEDLNNIPVLNGMRNFTTMALKGLNERVAI